MRGVALVVIIIIITAVVAVVARELKTEFSHKTDCCVVMNRRFTAHSDSSVHCV